MLGENPLQRWNVLVNSFRCYECTAIIIVLFLSVRGSTLDVRFWRLMTVPAMNGLSYLNNSDEIIMFIEYTHV